MLLISCLIHLVVTAYFFFLEIFGERVKTIFIRFRYVSSNITPKLRRVQFLSSFLLFFQSFLQFIYFSKFFQNLMNFYHFSKFFFSNLSKFCSIFMNFSKFFTFLHVFFFQISRIFSSSSDFFSKSFAIIFQSFSQVHIVSIFFRVFQLFSQCFSLMLQFVLYQ